METLEISETLVEGLVTSKQDGTQNSDEETCSMLFNSGEVKCAESGCMDSVNVDVSMKGISIFVELKGDDSKCMDERMSSENGQSLHGNNGEAIVCHQECRMNVGDFVWAITKNELWWPAIVCDDSSAPKEAAKVQRKEGGSLVRCFGNGSYLWCFPYQLKPFVECFELFSKQSNSKSFVGALEKAVAELGRRVKTEFTCSCFSKKVVDRRDDVGSFEPEIFVENIKDLARDITMPSKIDCIVNMNRLSAFYCYLGHFRIPMHNLRPENDAKDIAKCELTSGTASEIKAEEGKGLLNEDSNTKNGENSSGVKSEKPYESRERRKSKFLCYPYVNLNLGIKGFTGELIMEEESKNDVDGGVDLTNVNGHSLKRPRRKWSSKPIKKHNEKSSNEVEVSVCSSMVLDELHCVALDWVYCNENRNFDSIESFISRFRKWAFNDFTSKVTNEPTVNQNTDKAKKDIKGPPTPNILPKKGRKKKDKAVLSPMAGKITTSGPVIIDFQNGASLEAQSLANEGEQVVLADQGLAHIEVKDAVSDLNEKGSILNFGDPLVTACLTGNNVESQLGILSTIGKLEPKKKRRKRKNMDSQAKDSTLTPDLNENGGKSQPQKKKAKRSKRKEEAGTPCIDLSYNKVQKEIDVKGTALLLKFSPDHPLPSNEDLNSVFCKYGPLNSAETLVLNEHLSGQVVFLDPSSAAEAFRGLEKDSPLGETLVNYRVQHISGAQANNGFKIPIKIPLGSKSKSSPFRQREAPDLVMIRKNLEMMTSMLEKAGDSLSMEMRAKLELEIKGLMNKVSTMAMA